MDALSKHSSQGHAGGLHGWLPLASWCMAGGLKGYPRAWLLERAARFISQIGELLGCVYGASTMAHMKLRRKILSWLFYLQFAKLQVPSLTNNCCKGLSPPEFPGGSVWAFSFAASQLSFLPPS